jgi:hypothetical protein
MGCVARHEGFSQVCVWPGTTVGAACVNEFKEFMANEFGVRVQYLEEILIKPGEKYAPVYPGMQGVRTDLFFAVHEDDVMKFAVPRLHAGIRWIEDVLAKINDSCDWYPQWVEDYQSWSW